MARRGRFRPEVVTWEDLENSVSTGALDFDQYDFKILVEGDSWVTLGGIPTSNLPWSLRFRKSALLCNCGSPGDTIKNMASIASNHKLRRAMQERWSPVAWDLIFISGGGNDLFDFADDVLIDQPKGAKAKNDVSDFVDKRKIRALLKGIVKGYKDIASLRNAAGSNARGVPIVVHTYDYPTPNNAPAKFFAWPVAGPWLYTAFVKNNIPDSNWVQLADHLADQLAGTLLSLDGANASGIRNCHVVDTRGLLRRAKPGAAGNSNDWLNEIHPNASGYEKMAAATDPTVAKLLAT